MILSKDILKKIRRIQIQTKRTADDILAGAYHSAFKGSGVEFEDVREYELGDEIRSIDWNVTAKMRRPYIKNFREERELTVMLVVDVSASLHFGSRESFKRDRITEISALLAFSAMKNQDKVGLILFTDQVECYLSPKKGIGQILRIIREILLFQPKHRRTDVKEALNFLCKIQKRRGVCFVLSDFLFTDYFQLFSLLAKRHDLTSLYITDPGEEHLPNMGLVHFSDLETDKTLLVDTSIPEVRVQFFKRAQERRKDHEKLMKKVNGGCICIRTNEPYSKVIQQYFHLRKRRR